MNEEVGIMDKKEKERDIEVKLFVKRNASKPKLNHQILSSNIVIRTMRWW